MGQFLSYPWSVLDLQPTEDKLAIKRAYARKLKLTRPEENAAGFQTLVQARDAALKHAAGEAVPISAAAFMSMLEGAGQKVGAPVERQSAPHARTRQQQEPLTTAEKKPRRPRGAAQVELIAPASPEPLPDVSSLLSVALQGKSSLDVTTSGDMVLQRLKDMPLFERAECESRLLAVAIAQIYNVARSHTGLFQGGGSTYQAKLSLLRALDQEFLWSIEDKRLVGITSESASAERDGLLNLIRHGDIVAPKKKDPITRSRRNSIWLWIFLIYALVKIVAVLGGL